jgi:signal peptidase I
VFLVYFLVISYLLLCLTLSWVFPKAGVESKKAWMPGVNFVEWCKIIGKKPIEALWLLFPIVNIFTFTAMAVDLVRSFGKHSFGASAAAVIYAPAIFGKIGKDESSKYEGPVLTQEADFKNKMEEAIKMKDEYTLKKLSENNPYKKSFLREWVESIVFAVFAAAFIRMFLIEAFVIPTSSMEGSLNVGDYLFVSKAQYGMRMPMTIAMVPLAHNTIPFINTESYLKKPSFGYHRLPALEKIEKGKPIVFNWPVGDSVYLTPQRSYFVKQVDQVGDSDPYLAAAVKNGDLRVRPVDKKDHYIKRCVATPGDSLLVKDREIYINGVKQKAPTFVQFQYLVTSSNPNYNKKKLSEIGISPEDQGEAELLQLDSAQYLGFTNTIKGAKLSEINTGGNSGSKFYRIGGVTDQNTATQIRDYLQSSGLISNLKLVKILVLNQAQIDELKKSDPSATFTVINNSSVDDHYFPFNKSQYPWSMDNYGPIWIPKAGATTPLTLSNLSLYQRIIAVYEKNDLKVENGKIYINGKEAYSYTFKQNYYWAMGDNRHMSEDSRMWGYVPEDHIVGKPLFIWFSTREGSMSKGINWNRIFKSADIR